MILFSFGCGSDEEEEQEEMEVVECDGSISITLDGESETFDSPISATFADVALDNSTELLIVWMEGTRSLNLQLVIAGQSLDCMPLGRINLKDLPSNVSILSFQYFELFGKDGSVSNVFIEDGGDGWVDITACDGENETLSLDFEFDGVSIAGDPLVVRGGSATDICFTRTK